MSVLRLDWETLRLFLHVGGATVWVGGQLILPVLVAPLRRVSAEAPRLAGRAYSQVAWWAYALLVGTGIWNVIAVGRTDPAFQHTLDVKLGFVAVSGLGALWHQRSSSRAALAAGGALGLLGALGALLYGVRLAQ